MRKFVVYLFFSLWVLLLVACGGEPDVVVSPPAGAAIPAVEGEAPAGADLPLPTLAATNTAQPSLPPPPTSVSTSTPLPGPEATATVEPVSLLDPADFGDGRNRLTGELAADPAVLQRRPIAVKISNSPASYTRPQSGLQDADLVFEHVTEGPITRFTAIIYGRSPETMGPIRSARLIDIELPVMYDAALAYSGSSIGVANKLFASEFRERILRTNSGGYYRTGEDKPFEHTLYGRPEQFWTSLEEAGLNVAPTFATQMAFASIPPDGGEPAGYANVNYRDWTIVEWRYDEETGRYLRWADDEAHLDANYGEQISAANVVILYAPHQQDFNICEHQTDTGCQAFATESQIWGQGPAVILRDGMQYAVTWKREQRPDMFTFYDAEGNVLPLQIGNTWFQVLPAHYIEPVEISP